MSQPLRAALSTEVSIAVRWTPDLQRLRAICRVIFKFGISTGFLFIGLDRRWGRGLSPQTISTGDHMSTGQTHENTSQWVHCTYGIWTNDKKHKSWHGTGRKDSVWMSFFHLVEDKKIIHHVTSWFIMSVSLGLYMKQTILIHFHPILDFYLTFYPV